MTGIVLRMPWDPDHDWIAILLLGKITLYRVHVTSSFEKKLKIEKLMFCFFAFSYCFVQLLYSAKHFNFLTYETDTLFKISFFALVQ